MDAHELENCCGVCEIGDFYKPAEPELLTKNLKRLILDYIKDSWSWDYYTDKKLAYKTTNFFIATTNEDQPYMTEPLKSLGFRSRTFDSKHGGKVFFWTRRGLPKEIQKEWKTWVKNELKENFS